MARKLDKRRVEELRDDGMSARDAGLTAQICPWPLFSPESKEWLHGWSMAGRFPASKPVSRLSTPEGER